VSTGCRINGGNIRGDGRRWTFKGLEAFLLITARGVFSSVDGTKTNIREELRYESLLIH
jgi:hypothetical protein